MTKKKTSSTADVKPTTADDETVVGDTAAKKAEEEEAAAKKLADEEADAAKKAEEEAAAKKLADEEADAAKKAEEEAAAKKAAEEEAGSVEEVAPPPPHYVSFFEQYIGFIESSQPHKAIVSLNNCIKAMLKEAKPSSFATVFDLFDSKKLMLNPTIILQSVAILPPADRAVVEIVTTVFHVMITKRKTELNLEMVRSVTKNEPFVTWCAKKLG